MSYWTDNRTKILGTATTIVAGLLSMIALGMFDANAESPALLAPLTVRWLTIVLSVLNMALGGGTVAVGVANASNVRVAEAKAVVATALQTALSTPPPGETLTKTVVSQTTVTQGSAPTGDGS